MNPTHIDHRRVDPGFELASLLLSTWMLADPPLRADLEQAMRAHVRRNSAFRQDLERVVRFNELARERNLAALESSAQQAALEQLYESLRDMP